MVGGTSVDSCSGVTGWRYLKDDASQQWCGRSNLQETLLIYWIYGFYTDWYTFCVEYFTPLQISNVLCGQPYLVTNLEIWGFSFMSVKQLFLASSYLFQGPVCFLLQLFHLHLNHLFTVSIKLFQTVDVKCVPRLLIMCHEGRVVEDACASNTQQVIKANGLFQIQAEVQKQNPQT